jgi:type I restriction enzyme, S subunit
MTELPKGWAVASFSQIGTWMGGGTPSKAVESFWSGPIPWISPKDMKTKIIRSTIDGITADAVDKSAAKLIPTGSVVIVARSGILAHTLPVAITAIESTLNQDMKALALSKGIESEFVAWGLRAFEQAILNKCRKGGTTVHSIEMPSLIAFEIPIPPTNEQRRIVQKVEAMFEQIDKGVESLRVAKTTLGLYRQSLLKSAFEGLLTAAWRAQNPDKLEPPKALLARIQKERETRYKSALDDWQAALSEWRAGGEVGRKPAKPSRPEAQAEVTAVEMALLPSIPQSWRFFRLADIAAVGSGMSVSKGRVLEDPVEVAYLRVANVQRGRLDLTEIKTMAVERSMVSSLSLQSGDVLFNEGGDRDKLGRGWVWESQVEPCITQNHVFRATPFRVDLTWSKFISQWGNSYGRDYFEQGGKQTTNLASINKSVLSALPVPVCSPAEQAEITRILDARLTAADVMEAEINAALLRAEALRQSILKQAFSGTLVPQNPTDEPAPTLLARIKAERAKAGKTKPRKTAHAG